MYFMKLLDSSPLTRRTCLKYLGVGLISISTISCTSLLTGCGGPKEQTREKGSILAVGSSALLPLVEVAAEEYCSTQAPGVYITVQGGGSGQGISQIAQGAVQIGNSDIFAEEKGINPADAHITDHKICVAGMGPVVNPGVTVDSLTTDQLVKIFTGELTNWNQVGGQDLPIVVINRAAGSGTRTTFETLIMKGASSVQAQEQDNNGTVVRMVSETPGAISYLSFSYFNDKTKQLKLNDAAPTSENVINGSWILWSYEHMYTAAHMDPTTEGFMEFMMGEVVQKELIPQLGYISVKDMMYERGVDGEMKKVLK